MPPRNHALAYRPVRFASRWALSSNDSVSRPRCRFRPSAAQNAWRSSRSLLTLNLAMDDDEAATMGQANPGATYGARGKRMVGSHGSAESTGPTRVAGRDGRLRGDFAHVREHMQGGDVACHCAACAHEGLTVFSPTATRRHPTVTKTA
jgi:hypothetical protein